MGWTIDDHKASAQEAIDRGLMQGDINVLAEVPEPLQSAQHQARVMSLSTLNVAAGPYEILDSPWEPWAYYNDGVEPPVDPPVEPPIDPGDFLSYPRIDPVEINSGSGIELSNFSIVGGTIAITLRNIDGLYIHDVDFADVVGGIYLYNCRDVQIENVRGRNIGDGSIGSGHSNFIQFAESLNGSVRGCTFIGGNTEDMISTWHSGSIVIEDNYLESPDWSSASGTGIILSDGEGSPNNGNITVRNNVLINPGQVGIQCIDGPNLKVYDNVVYGEARPWSNQPFSSWEGHPEAEIYHNTHRWYKPDGTQTGGWFHVPVDYHDNTYDPNLDPDDYRVTL